MASSMVMRASLGGAYGRLDAIRHDLPQGLARARLRALEGRRQEGEGLAPARALLHQMRIFGWLAQHRALPAGNLLLVAVARPDDPDHTPRVAIDLRLAAEALLQESSFLADLDLRGPKHLPGPLADALFEQLLLERDLHAGQVAAHLVQSLDRPAATDHHTRS